MTRDTAAGTRDSRPFQATHLFFTSLRTTPEALLQTVRDRWSIEVGTGFVTPSSMKTSTATGVMAPARWPLRTAAMNLLQLAGFRSIRDSMQAVMHDTTTQLAMENLTHAETLTQP